MMNWMGVVIWVVLIGWGWNWVEERQARQTAEVVTEVRVEQSPEEPTLKPTLILVREVGEVPWTVQAPGGDWDNPKFQDGCEEAASWMAAAWARGEEIDAGMAGAELTNIWDWQVERYGGARDTSAADTAERILRGYFGLGDVKVEAMTVAAMAARLAEGRLVVVPTDGRKLGNPYFSNGGPERHMVVVVGYDRTRKRFVTNDPGTRWGKGYEYAEEVMEGAVGDYVTGNHEPIQERGKVMISIGREAKG